MKRRTIIITAAILAIAAVAWSAKISEYARMLSAAVDDLLVIVDVSDSSMAPSGTTKAIAVGDLPVSTATQAALDAKQDSATASTDAERQAHETNTLNPHSVTAAQAGAEPAMTPASQAEMEAGTEAALRSMSPLRIAQAIAALAPGAGATMGDIAARSTTPGSPVEGYWYWFANTTDGGADDPANQKGPGDTPAGTTADYRALWCSDCDAGSPKWFAVIDSHGRWIVESIDWSILTNTPTTLSGYGITDGASATHTHTIPDRIIFVFKSSTALTVAERLRIPDLPACTITGWTIAADQSATATVDLWKDTAANYPPDNTDSITASATPGIVAASRADSTTLTGWTTAIADGDDLIAAIEANDAAREITLTLEITRTVPTP